MVLFLVMHFSIHTVIIFWMNQWANSNDYQNQMYTLVYVILAVVAGFVSIAIVHHIYTRPHYRDLPAKVIEALLLSPLEYFMSVPSAKIVRVLSSDQRIYDRVLGQSLTRLFLYISAFLSNILVIILVAFIIRNFFFLGNQILFVAALSYICSKFLAAQRKYSGLQNEVKLPMNSTFDETLDGISTIRAHGK
jgi:ATP-binding cassette subfamily C (CFTR/MRP) protein 1